MLRRIYVGEPCLNRVPSASDVIYKVLKFWLDRRPTPAIVHSQLQKNLTPWRVFNRHHLERFVLLVLWRKLFLPRNNYCIDFHAPPCNLSSFQHQKHKYHLTNAKPLMWWCAFLLNASQLRAFLNGKFTMKMTGQNTFPGNCWQASNLRRLMTLVWTIRTESNV